MKRSKTISVADFRGFYKSQTVSLAIPNSKPGSGLTVVVGPNNSGKTSLLEVIKRFYVGDPPQFDREERHAGKDVNLELTNSDGEVKTLITKDDALGISNGQAFYPQRQDFFFISSRRYFETYFGTDKISHEDHRNMLYSLSKSGSDSNFGRRMIEISNSKSTKATFDGLMKRLIPHFNTWNIELSREQNYIRYITGANDEHSSELFGDGIISLFKIAAALVNSPVLRRMSKK